MSGLTVLLAAFGCVCLIILGIAFLVHLYEAASNARVWLRDKPRHEKELAACQYRLRELDAELEALKQKEGPFR